MKKTQLLKSLQTELSNAIEEFNNLEQEINAENELYVIDEDNDQENHQRNEDNEENNNLR